MFGEKKPPATCARCGAKTGIMDVRVKYADGYLCENCLKEAGIGFWKRANVDYLDWAKQHSWEEASEFAPVQKPKPKSAVPTPQVDAVNDDRLHCPHCHSTNVQPMGQHKKGFSVGKAVGGAVLTGGVGALAGFVGKKTKKVDWVCLNCGKSFTV